MSRSSSSWLMGWAIPTRYVLLPRGRSQDCLETCAQAEGWPSLARFLSHFPSLIRLVIDITAYESVMYTTSIPHKPISMKKLAARLEPQRLAAEQPLLAQLLVFLRSTSVLQLYIRRTWLRGHELRATRATRDDDFSFERWDVTKLQM